MRPKRRSRRDAVRLGAHSIHRKPRDHTAYAQALLEIDRSQDAFNVLEGVVKAFPKDAAAALEAQVCKFAV